MGCGGECGDCSVVCVSRVQPMNKVRYLRYTGQVTNQYGTCDSERTSEGKKHMASCQLFQVRIRCQAGYT